MVQPIEIQPSADLVLDTTNRTLAKFQVLYLRGIRSNFPSQYFFFSFRGLPLSPLIQDTELQEIEKVAVAIERSKLPVMFPWFQQDEVPPDVASVTRRPPRASRVLPVLPLASSRTFPQIARNWTCVAHDGTVTVHDACGQYSKFAVTSPASSDLS